jgi:hypothetical protein
VARRVVEDAVEDEAVAKEEDLSGEGADSTGLAQRAVPGGRHASRETRNLRFLFSARSTNSSP